MRARFVNRLFESPDDIIYKGKALHYQDEDAYVFGINPDDEFEMGLLRSSTHLSIIFKNGHDYNRRQHIYPGRIWLKRKLISFWTYPRKSEIKHVIKMLEDAFLEIYNIDIDIWNDPQFKIEISTEKIDYKGKNLTSYPSAEGAWHFNVDKKIIYLKDYVYSINASEEELNKEHIISPMNKKHRNIPERSGSKRYSSLKPLELRQLELTSESLTHRARLVNVNI